MNIKDNTSGSLQDYVKRKLRLIFDTREVEVVTSMLFEHFLRLDRADLVIGKDKRVTEAEILQFYSAIEELKQNKPIQYILGETEFYGLKIKVNQDVLIPRPETEELVDWILSINKNLQASILDVGTGSGCIPLALKAALPNASIWGSDVSAKALAVATNNAQLLNLEVNFTKNNILTDNINIPNLDIIVSNPPYIPTKDKALMEHNVLDYEPALALFVDDDDPLLFYRVIIEKSRMVLIDRGYLFFEIHENYSTEIVLLLENMKYDEIEIKTDLQGKARMIKARKTC